MKLRKKRLEDRVAEVREIQSSLLPSHAPDFHDYDLAGRTVSAEEVGGDLYDFIPVSHRSLGVAVADLLRRNEDEFRNADDLPQLDDDDALAAWIAKHPRVLQRPIVVDAAAGVAIIGRPPENVHPLLQS